MGQVGHELRVLHADLDGLDWVAEHHVDEAFSLRSRLQL